MVILRLTNPVSPEFEYESSVQDAKSTVEDRVLVRPCERYKEMYSSCRSIRGRLHQYYVYGELVSCDDYRKNYDDCLSFRKTKDTKYLVAIIEWEKGVKAARQNAERANTAWQFRDHPPDDFEKPLPEFLAERQRSSTFKPDNTP